MDAKQLSPPMVQPGLSVGTLMSTLAITTPLDREYRPFRLWDKAEGDYDKAIALGNRMRLYGEMFEMVGDPIIVNDTVVIVDAIETKSGECKRVRIPLPILKMAAERAA